MFFPDFCFFGKKYPANVIFNSGDTITADAERFARIVVSQHSMFCYEKCDLVFEVELFLLVLLF